MTTELDYNNLPNDPQELFDATFDPKDHEAAMNSAKDQACIAPTWGIEDGCAVIVVIVEGERKAFKAMLTKYQLELLVDYADTMMSCMRDVK